MDISKIEKIIGRKVCPMCELGAVKEIEGRVYRCVNAQCGEVFDLSLLSEKMIGMLLDQELREQESVTIQ